MDLEMPMMNGYEATETIRKTERECKYPKTYICGLSASTGKGSSVLNEKESVDVEQQCMASGMNDCLSKPLDMERMLKLIGKQFDSIKKKA